MHDGSATMTRSRLATILIVLGAVMFVIGLTVSAAFAPEWRRLHVLQALIYVAIVALAWRNSAWGFGVGLVVAGFWNWLSTFATTATHDGIAELMSVVKTGSVHRPDLLLSLFAFTGHILIMLGCAIGFARLRPGRREWVQLIAGGAASLVYLFAIVFAFGPPAAIQLMRSVFGR